MLRVGNRAPEIDAMGSDGKRFRLSESRGRFTVIYFFPRAFTPNCTRESLRFRDNSAELRTLGADVLGVSTDDHATQCAFASELKVAFPLIADSSGAIARAYGVLWPVVGIPRRATFIVGAERRLEAVFWHEIQVSRHLDDVLQFLRKQAAALGHTLPA